MPQLHKDHKATNNKRTGPCEWSFAYPPSGKCAAAELQKRCMPGRLECRPKQNIAVMAVSFPKALPNQRAQRLSLKFTCRACQRQVPTISIALILCNPRSKLPNFIPCLVPLSEMLHKFHDLLSCDISSTPIRSTSLPKAIVPTPSHCHHEVNFGPHQTHLSLKAPSHQDAILSSCLSTTCS